MAQHTIASLLTAVSLLATTLAPTLTQAASTPTTVASAASAVCAHCGTVTAVTAHKKKGKGSGLGLIAGAVLGGVVGNQFGKGTGNTVTTVGGAVAGGAVGNEIEKNSNKHTVFATQIKMDDGSTRDITLGQQFAVGARVTVEGNQVHLKP